MNALSALTKANSRPMGGDGSSNLAVEVTGFEVEGTDTTKHYVVGKLLGTDETIKVALRAPKDDAEKAKFADRPVIKDGPQAKNAIATNDVRRHKTATAIGGVVLFEGAYKDSKTGNYLARWPKVLSHTPDEARVFTGMVSVTPPREGTGGKVSQSAYLLHTKEAKKVAGKDVAATVAAAIDAHGGAIIRVIDGDSHEDVALYRSAQKDAAGAIIGQKNGADSFGQFTEENEKGKILASVLGNEGLAFDVIPVTRAFFGGETALQNHKETKFYARTEAPFQMKEGDAVKGYGVTESVIAIKKSRDGQGEFVAHAQPTKSRPTLVDRTMVATENFVPKTLPESARKGVQATDHAGETIDPVGADPNDLTGTDLEAAGEALKAM